MREQDNVLSRVNNTCSCVSSNENVLPERFTVVINAEVFLPCN